MFRFLMKGTISVNEGLNNRMRGNRLGAILVRHKIIELQDLRRALQRHRATGMLLGQCLILMDICNDTDIAMALKVQRKHRQQGGPAWGELLRQIQFS